MYIIATSLFSSFCIQICTSCMHAYTRIWLTPRLYMYSDMAETEHMQVLNTCTLPL